MINKFKNELCEFRLLINSVPTLTVVFFIVCVFSMNIMANKSIAMPFEHLALDCGILFSWFTFLIMDITTKHFGPKGATELSLLGIFINLIICLMFFIASKIPGNWSESYIAGSETIINNALDKTFGGTWYVLLGSTVSFAVSAFVNNFLNYSISTAFKKNPDSFIAYISSTYVSTAVGQFTDNLIFAFLVSRVFFGWSITQCISSALTGMIFELLCEFVFSVFGFRICRRWKKENVGKEYIDYIKQKEKNR